MPRIWKLVRVLRRWNETFGTDCTKSRAPSMPWAFMAFCENADTAIGTSCMDSSRFCAVTISSSTIELS